MWRTKLACCNIVKKYSRPSFARNALAYILNFEYWLKGRSLQSKKIVKLSIAFIQFCFVVQIVLTVNEGNRSDLQNSTENRNHEQYRLATKALSAWIRTSRMSFKACVDSETVCISILSMRFALSQDRHGFDQNSTKRVIGKFKSD